MLKRWAVITVMLFGLTLQGCVSGTAGLKSYVDSYDGYEFLYPNGWVSAKIANGPDVVLHDLIDQAENVSVVISEVEADKTLTDLGTPSEVGQRLANNAISSSDGQRKAELISAESHDSSVGPYYIMEYAVELPNMARHNLASVVVRRNKLFTLSVSTSERRWNKVKEEFYIVANSFSVY
ncbi:MAG: photosystem II oxygen evolving complex protein PsbP [Cyanothece sp. SIO2G6]|nr:photosystem II oxygen evolving complex protein PsbP [Cyanothece sp. SIO2G6]